MSYISTKMVGESLEQHCEIEFNNQSNKFNGINIVLFRV